MGALALWPGRRPRSSRMSRSGRGGGGEFNAAALWRKVVLKMAGTDGQCRPSKCRTAALAVVTHFNLERESRPRRCRSRAPVCACLDSGLGSRALGRMRVRTDSMTAIWHLGCILVQV